MDLQARKLKGKKIFTFASGKGGVGKTTVSVNVAVEISTKAKVLLVDADMSLGNADIILGVSPQKHIGHIIEGNTSPDSVAYPVNPNLWFVAGASGVEKFSNITKYQFERIKRFLNSFDTDFIILDAPAGIGENVLRFSEISKGVFCILSPEPASITDTYALIKVLTKRGYTGRFFVIVNLAENEKIAQVAVRALKKVCAKFLNLEPEYIGWIPYDHAVVKSFRAQKPVVSLYPSSPASEHIRKIAEKMYKIS